MTALTDFRIVSVRQLHYKVVAPCLFRSFRHLFHRSVRLTETDVVRDSVMEQVYVLEHEAEIFHKAVHAVFPHVMPSELYDTLVHIPEA